MVLMFTDIVGSVDLRRRIGDQDAAQIIKRHDEIFRKTVSAFPFAEILKDLGDGFLARFSSASDAVHAALHFQSVLHAEDWHGQKIQARVGLHLGEVSEMDVEETTGKPKLSGLAVDLTARVMGLALPGQILMTRAAFDNARQYVREQQSATGDSPAITRKWIAHGRYLFKGAEEALEVFEVGEVGVAPLKVPPDSEKARRAVAADQEETLGWRPAVGMDIPERKNWVLERRLGEGGFGEVWLGEHTQSKARRVFKFCFDADRLRSLKRELMLFRLLRDALGDRNDIAKLHEVQMETPPFYLESEFTEDGSLVEWSATKGGIDKIPLETRLDIVARTAMAVAAAHSVGILHKDIKPSNILIYREHDGAVRPRLTDFGIGEITDPSELAKRNIMVTGMSDSFMTTSGGTTTRVYAPPEVLVGKPFTIQGDVYGLGVLLYQMVVGDLERPVAEGWERDVPDPLLQDDIARCIEGHPGERLSSAKELAERLQTLPARRRARRRKQIARASVVASIILAGLLALTMIWTVRERGLRLETEAQYRKQKAIKDFFISMMTATDPRENPGEGRNVRVVDRLDKGVVQLDGGELSDDPDTQSAVRAAIGNVYRSLGQLVPADAQLQKAVDTRRTIDPASEELAQILEDYGAIKWNTQRYSDAEKIFSDSLEMRKALFGEESLEVASSLNYLAANHDRQGKHEEAQGLYERALELRKKLATEPNRTDLIARSTNNLGTCLRSQKKFDEAIRYFEDAVRMVEQKYGKDYIDVGNGKNNIATCLYGKKEYGAAERMFLDALDIKKRALGDKNYYLATTYEGLADTYRELGRLADAEQHYAHALEMRQFGLTEGHPAISESFETLASVQSAQGKHADAEQTIRSELENRKKAARQDEAGEHDANSRLGACLAAQGNLEDAEPLLTSSYEALKLLKGASDTVVRQAAGRLADLYDKTGRNQLAVTLRANSGAPTEQQGTSQSP